MILMLFVHVFLRRKTYEIQPAIHIDDSPFLEKNNKSDKPESPKLYHTYI